MKLGVRSSLAAWVAAALLCVSTRAWAEPLPEPTLSPGESSQLRSLELKLDDVSAERASTSTVLPWAVVGVGIAAILVGGSLGIAKVASCDESCTSAFWPSWLVVGGAGLSAAGLIWLRLVQEDIAELESRRYHLQMQIDGYETLREARSQRALLQVSATF
jgi:hypothetical protein